MVTTESEALASLCGQIDDPLKLNRQAERVAQLLKQLDERHTLEAERLALENALFGRHDDSRISGRPHHLDHPLHGGVEVNLGFRRP